MIKKPEVKKNFYDVMQEYGCVFSLNTKDGFVNIEYQNGKHVVTYLHEEGQTVDADEMPIEDIVKVANFFNALKELKLEQYQK